MQFYPAITYRSPIFSVKNNINEEIFSEALYLSSPVLFEEYQKYLNGQIKDEKEKRKVQISIYKYKTRASNRCTPFGLFAGLGKATWGEAKKIEIDANFKKTLKRKTHLDMDVLCSLAQEITKLPFVKPYLVYTPNTSIYLVANTYRYVEYYYINNIRHHKINKVDHSDFLELILTKSKQSLTQTELCNLLITDKISVDEATNFIEEIISSQLLVNQFEPTLIGPDFFVNLFNQICCIQKKNTNSELNKLINLLSEINTLLKEIDNEIINSIERYKIIFDKLKTFLPNLTETNLFQTDLYKISKESTLNYSIQEKILKCLKFLDKITPKYNNQNFEDFKKQFNERYESFEIPLLHALDKESGIGYPNKDNYGINELINDVYISNDENDQIFKWSRLQSILAHLIIDASTKKNKTISITEKDFEGLGNQISILPDTLAVMFNVLNNETGKIYLKNSGGSSAVNLLGRFAGNNKELETITREITEFEQTKNSDVILAEIVHLPESRTGNILARPAFRKYEIPYLAKSCIGGEFQIKMENLYLKLEGDRIILFDKYLQKEIVPRLGNAHNYSYNSLPVYHFLCDLQYQGVSKPFLNFNWGILANQFKFLPRVEFEDCVISAARWQLQKKDLEPLKNKSDKSEAKLNLFSKLRNEYNIPDQFLIADGDNELLINCNDSIAIDTFFDLIKNRDNIVLEEFLFDHENALIKDTDGNSYTNECIAIILNNNKKEAVQTEIKIKEKVSKQQFPIGSEWLYYKIYCGPKTADYILTDKIKIITEKLLTENTIDSWFFIRYADPDVHLRFRLHISNMQKYGEVIQLIYSELNPLLNERIISKLQTDTYIRELERYGDNSIETIEKLFYHDSIFATNMLDLLDAESGDEIRWQIALRSVNQLLSDFKFSIEEKYNLINNLSISFFNEHGGKKELKLLLDSKYRDKRLKIEEVLNENINKEIEYYPIIEILNQRSVSSQNLVNMILLLNNNKGLEMPLNNLLASLLHMNLDRLFMGKNRTNEFVVYDILARYYKSTIARKQSTLKKQQEITN